MTSIVKLVGARDILWAWSARTIRARYQQSVLGGLWMVIQPVATVVVLTVIFTMFVPIDTGPIPYAVFAYVGALPWMLLSNSLSDMSSAVVANMQLVTKVYFPREVLPLAALLARLLDFIIGLGILVILCVYFDILLVPYYCLWFLGIVLVQLMLLAGVGLMLAAANVFFRDVQPLLTITIQLWFYLSPIIYPSAVVPERLRPLYFLNPMAGILEGYRAVLLHQTVPDAYIGVSAFASLGALVTGYWMFKSVEARFADII